MVKVVVGDYTARKDSWLKELEELSQRRGDQGLLHSGCILWIQSYLDENFGFTLKAAIAPVLDAVPSIFPKDLPQQLEKKKKTMVLTEEMQDFLIKLNNGLIFPISPEDIVRIIIAGQEYEGWKEA